MTIYDEVRNGLKNYLSQNSTYKPSVKPFASGNDFPYVVFEKINDIERESDSSRNTVISSIEFERICPFKTKWSQEEVLQQR